MQESSSKYVSDLMHFRGTRTFCLNYFASSCITLSFRDIRQKILNYIEFTGNDCIMHIASQSCMRRNLWPHRIFKKPSQYCMEIFALYSLHSAICFQLHYILLKTTMSAIYNAGTLQVYSNDFARPHCETFEGQWVSLYDINRGRQTFEAIPIHSSFRQERIEIWFLE